MKTNCTKFSDSISPTTMPETNKDIKKLLDCLKEDFKIYISSLEIGKEGYIHHFRNSILPILRKRRVLDSFENQMSKYNRVLDTKTVSASHDFVLSMKKLENDVEEVRALGKYKNLNGRERREFLTESIKIAYVDFSKISVVASQLFFALEFYCRICCALGCIKFALNAARFEIIQHNRLWKQLKRFSDKNCSYCETCIINNTCTSKIDFKALSRIYSYSMKIRQIADYTPKFISFDIIHSSLIEPPFIYFTCLESLLKNKSIIYECLADVTPKILLRKTITEELTSPFLWGDEKRLKESLSSDENNDFYNYLLGRFYYQHDRFEKATEYLEKAKKINPNNADTWKLLGIAYDAEAKELKDLKRATCHLRRAQTLEPLNSEVLFQLGLIEFASGDISSSFHNLIKASECASTDFERIEIFAVLSEVNKMEGITEKHRNYLQKYNEIVEVFKPFKSELYLNEVIEWLKKYVEERRKLK